ncbi:hypothetical protein RQP46_011190 [Phenoliferia psychrophenolica]
MLSEHPPYMPTDGAWYTRQIVEAVQNSPKYANTVLLISYDETGPGFRLPFLAISPFTRGSNVFTEANQAQRSLFLEKWLEAKGIDIKIEAINDWRREHMSDLVSMFNFDKPDYSKVQLPNGTTPHSTDGLYDGAIFCEETYGDLVIATVPYGEQMEETALFQESGFKTVRGAITEGRYLSFESGGYAFAYTSTASRNKQFSFAVAAEKAAPLHNKKKHLVVLEALDPSLATAKVFRIRFAGAAGTEPAYWDSTLSLVSKSHAETFTVTDQGGSAGYTVQASDGKYVSLLGGKLSLVSDIATFDLFSVTF